MPAWKSVVALAVVGAFVAGPVWAQSTTTPPADKPAGAMDKKPGDTKMDKSMDKSTTGTDKAGMEKMDKAAGKAAKAGNRDHVKAVQQALKDKGHDPGPVDGVMGAKTKAALREFQKAQGMKESGSLDNETMTKLGVEMKTGSAGMSSPAASPATDNASKPADNATKPTEEKK
jgi:peptidoglycan hydrolase-like protein with peptidoglycan-binding domain